MLLFPAISHLTHLTFKSDVEVAASHPAPPNIFHPAAGLQNWWIFGAGKEPEPQGNSCPVRHHMHRIWHQSFSHSRKPKATASLYNSAFAPNVHIRHGTHQVEALRVTARRLQYIQRTLQVQAPTTRAFSLAQGAAIREELQATKDACYLETSWVAPFLLFLLRSLQQESKMTHEVCCTWEASSSPVISTPLFPGACLPASKHSTVVTRRVVVQLWLTHVQGTRLTWSAFAVKAHSNCTSLLQKKTVIKLPQGHMGLDKT